MVYHCLFWWLVSYKMGKIYSCIIIRYSRLIIVCQIALVALFIGLLSFKGIEFYYSILSRVSSGGSPLLFLLVLGRFFLFLFIPSFFQL